VPPEHRRRVETRLLHVDGDLPGLVPPRWEAVVARDYEAWDRPRVVIDTAQRSVADALAELRVRLATL